MADVFNAEQVARTDSVYRIISARYPNINLFGRVADAQEFDILYAIEAVTNDRLRDQVGEINLVRPQDKLFGEGTSCIMAAFTHPPQEGAGGRFNKDFGAYYCAFDETMAIAETSYHQGIFYRDARIGEIKFQMRVLKAELTGKPLHDLTPFAGDDRVSNRDDYAESQIIGAKYQQEESYGLLYCSVRAKGNCVCVLRPPALRDCFHLKFLSYHFDGDSVVDVSPVKVSEASTNRH